jgi:GT2 family glycosyltransferase
MTVGVITTNYNTWALTSTCIEHCLKYADDTIDQFVVVDDHSTEPFINNFDHVQLIRNEQNFGLVKSLNRGLASVDTDLVILFDSDAWPLENYILKTKQYFRDNPKVGIAAYQTENASGKPAVAYEAEPDAMSIVLGQKLHGYYQKLFNNNPKQITVYTCAMVLRKEVIEQVGGFDESYDWLELDHDICMSAIRKGWDIGIIPVRAFHKGSGTPQRVSKRVIRFYQNRMKLLKKFKKYPAAPLLNTFILSRLMLEYFSINTLGRLKMSKEIREDKSYSRSQLISMFVKGQI